TETVPSGWTARYGWQWPSRHWRESSNRRRERHGCIGEECPTSHSVVLVLKYRWPGSIIPEPGASEQRRGLLARGYAACTSMRKRRTSPSRLSASCASVSASDLTSAATVRASREVPARRLMASLLERASADARLTPSLIEATARFCSSTVTATVPAIREISSMMVLTCSMAWAASATPHWIAPTWAAISPVALAVWPASDLTSEATTAKPLPASPARAASMVALSASRLVWPAIALISLTTSPIFCAALASPLTVSLVRADSSTAFPPIVADS